MKYHRRLLQYTVVILAFLGEQTGTVTAAMQIALITGGNRGIGKEVCRQLASLGDYTVILASRDISKGQQAVQDLGFSDEIIIPVELDVTSESSIRNAKQIVAQRYGRLDLLVNNAGINYDSWQRTISADIKNVQETMETNLYGPWRCSMTFMDLLQKSSNPRIVNVSSGAGSVTGGMGSGTPAYSVSKAALNALTQKLASELPRFKVNAVCPGWVATDMGGAGGAPIEQGGASVLYACTLDSKGPTGGIYRDGKPTNW